MYLFFKVNVLFGQSFKTSVSPLGIQHFVYILEVKHHFRNGASFWIMGNPCSFPRDLPVKLDHGAIGMEMERS